MCSPNGNYPPLPPQCRTLEKTPSKARDYIVEPLEKHDDSILSLLWKAIKAILQGRF